MSAIGYSIPGYELERRLGEGGMATVFLATQRSLDRRVAIKVMRRGATDETEEKRFLNEGRTLARLPHPNIVGIHDIVQTAEINYIAMEYLDGGTLVERMQAGLSLSDAVGIVVQIADALEFAHENGVVHRDLKPSNIMFRGARTPVLTDFGIARSNSLDGERLTQTGMMIGTPAYMSPEQAQGGNVDGRSDQYSLGILFFEMLARKLPFGGETPMQIAYNQVHTPPPSLPLKYEFFQPLIHKMLAKDPKQRFLNMKAFARELKQVVTDNPEVQQRLKVNPGQSVSEQLRALGFSDSQIHNSRPRPAVNLPPVATKDVHLPPEMVAKQMLEQAHLNLELEPLRDTRRPTMTGSAAGSRERNGGKGQQVWLIPAVVAAIVVLVVVAKWATQI